MGWVPWRVASGEHHWVPKETMGSSQSCAVELVEVIRSRDPFILSSSFYSQGSPKAIWLLWKAFFPQLSHATHKFADVYCQPKREIKTKWTNYIYIMAHFPKLIKKHMNKGLLGLINCVWIQGSAHSCWLAFENYLTLLSLHILIFKTEIVMVSISCYEG